MNQNYFCSTLKDLAENELNWGSMKSIPFHEKKSFCVSNEKLQVWVKAEESKWQQWRIILID